MVLYIFEIMGKTSRVALIKEKREIAEYLSEDPSHTQAEARRIFSKKFNRPLPRMVICRISKQSDKFWEHGTQKYRMREALFPEFAYHLYKQLT